MIIKDPYYQIADAEVIVNGFGIIDKSVIDECPNLQLIQQTGIDRLDRYFLALKKQSDQGILDIFDSQ